MLGTERHVTATGLWLHRDRVGVHPHTGMYNAYTDREVGEHATVSRAWNPSTLLGPLAVSYCARESKCEPKTDSCHRILHRLFVVCVCVSVSPYVCVYVCV